MNCYRRASRSLPWLIVGAIGLIALVCWGAVTGWPFCFSNRPSAAVLPPTQNPDSLRGFLNSNPAGGIVILSVKGLPSNETWDELRSGMIRIGAQRETNLARGASLLLIGVMDSRPGSVLCRMGVQEVEIELEKGQEIGATRVKSPCHILARSLGSAEPYPRSMISVDSIRCSPNEVGVNAVAIDRDGNLLARASFR